MKKQKTGFWKTHPLLKAITVLVVFFLVLGSLYGINDPIVGYVVTIFYYMAGGLYILGGIYGIWLDRRCHLKFPSVCLVFLVLIITISIVHFYLFIYPGWKLNGYILWDYMRNAIFVGGGQILSVAVGFILSKIISYINKKMKQGG